MENQTVRIAVIDDDPFVLTHLSSTLKQRFPNAEITGVSEPTVPIGYDVYIVDREFGEDQCGLDLIKRVKRLAPESVVVAYSAFLDRDYLRSLILEHCEGAFDKGSLEELDKMIKLIAELLAKPGDSEKGSPSPRETVRSIFELVREWNTRLSQNGHAAPRYHSNV